jgi:cytochrome c556
VVAHAGRQSTCGPLFGPTERTLIDFQYGSETDLGLTTDEPNRENRNRPVSCAEIFYPGPCGDIRMAGVQFSLLTLTIKEESEMKRIPVMLTMAAVLLAFAAGAAAEGVVKTDMTPDSQVVMARKMLMRANKANMGSMMKEIGEGESDSALANAASLSAVAMVLPPLYAKEYASVYPVEGSKTFFKPGDPGAFEAAAGALQMEAMAVHKALSAKDMAGAKAAAEKLGGACGACHSQFQGQYK